MSNTGGNSSLDAQFGKSLLVGGGKKRTPVKRTTSPVKRTPVKSTIANMFGFMTKRGGEDQDQQDQQGGKKRATSPKKRSPKRATSPTKKRAHKKK